MSKPAQTGRLFVIAAPSGAGKTTLVHRLMDQSEALRFSISYTTRARRKTEKHGRDYFFVDEKTFLDMAEAGEFLEHARVFDHRYGTARTQVEELLDAGHHVILEIDWQGAQQVRANMPGCTSIFILPPSVATLRERLTARGTDSADVIERRFRDALSDMSHWQEFDYAVINDDLDAATRELAAIVEGAPESVRNRTDHAAMQERIERLLEAPAAPMPPML